MNKSIKNYYLNQKILRQIKIQKVIKQFVFKNLVLICSIVDKEGFFIAFEIDSSIKNMIDLELLQFYNLIVSIKKKGGGILEFEQSIEMVSYYGVETTSIKLLIKRITKDALLITIIPSWVDLNYILPEFKKVIKNLSNFLKYETLSENIH